MAMPRAAIRNACCTPSPDDPATAYPGTILDDASSIYSSIGVRGFDQYASAVQRHMYFVCVCCARLSMDAATTEPRV